MEPEMEVISGPRSISGSAIIGDLLDRLGERLSRDCNLRGTDAYSGYAATVKVDLQLVDVDRTEVHAEVSIGAIDAGQRVQHVAMGANAGAPENEALGEGLERPTDPGGAVEAPKQKRYYTPRKRAVR